MMRVGIAADHGRLALKEQLAELLRFSGYQFVDFGAHQLDPGDAYSDFIIPLARAVAAGKVERGVAICGSGMGASVAANNVAGVRAALIHDVFPAHRGVGDDNINVFCLPERVIGPALAWKLIETFPSSLQRRSTPLTPLGESPGAGEAGSWAMKVSFGTL
jgi:ribose 5-phosphate isomerase B